MKKEENVMNENQHTVETIARVEKCSAGIAF